jgi:hypothetical protein
LLDQDIGVEQTKALYPLPVRVLVGALRFLRCSRRIAMAFRRDRLEDSRWVIGCLPVGVAAERAYQESAQ